jgi:hypothetical protein
MNPDPAEQDNITEPGMKEEKMFDPGSEISVLIFDRSGSPQPGHRVNHRVMMMWSGRDA